MSMLLGSFLKTSEWKRVIVLIDVGYYRGRLL